MVLVGSIEASAPVDDLPSAADDAVLDCAPTFDGCRSGSPPPPPTPAEDDVVDVASRNTDRREEKSLAMVFSSSGVGCGG